MQIIDLFLITGELDDISDYIKKLSLGKKPSTNYTFPIFYEADSCLRVIHSLENGVSYRLWIHLGLPEVPDKVKETDVKAFFETKLFDDNNIRYNLISRISKNSIDVLIEKLHKVNPNFNGKIFSLLDAINNSFNIIEAEINIVSTNITKTNIQISQPAENIDELKIDVVVISAVQEEQEPLLEIFNKPAIPKEIKVNNHNLHLRSVKNNRGEYKVIGFVKQLKMGMIDAAILATQVIEQLKPSIIVMTGICGGKPTYELNYGDIIIPNKAFAFQFGKIEENENKEVVFKKSLACSSTDRLISNFSSHCKNILVDVKKSIRNNKVLETKIKTENKSFEKLGQHDKKVDIDGLTVHLEKDMACSTSVIDQEGYFKEHIGSVDRDAIAVEMESFGIAQACERSSSGVNCLIIKSVMDKTQGKSDLYKEYSAYTSAYFFYFLVKKGYL